MKGLLLFSGQVVSDSLRPHGLQHARPLCPSPTPGAYWNSCPSSRWCHPTISSSVIPFSSSLQSFPASGSFPMSWLFPSDWPKYWSFSFSISPSNEYSGLISFRMDWLDLLAVQGALKSLLQYHSSKASTQGLGTLKMGQPGRDLLQLRRAGVEEDQRTLPRWEKCDGQNLNRTYRRRKNWDPTGASGLTPEKKAFSCETSRKETKWVEV